MNRIKSISTKGEVLPKPEPFSVTIFYENRSAARYAKGVLDFLKAELAGAREVQVNLWRLDFLQIDEVKNEITRDIETSDLVIVSGSLDKAERRRLLQELRQTVSDDTLLPELLILDYGSRILCAPAPADQSGQISPVSAAKGEWRFQHC